MTQLVEEIYTTLTKLISTRKASALVGISRSTPGRRAARPIGCARKPGRKSNPNKLTCAEKDAIIAACSSEDNADKSIPQVFYQLLDAGIYRASMSTYYRVLRERGMVKERRRQATHPPQVKPELVATGPDQVFSWDITQMATPVRGVFCNAYVMMDVWSRRMIHA